MRLLNRYVLREHLGPLVFALTALTALMLLNYIAKEFGKLVGKGLPWSVIGEFFLLAIPFTVAMTLPMAVLVATLYAFGRLAAENEITAIKASGIGINRLLVPVLVGGACLSLMMVGFNDQVLPRANHRLRNLQEDISQKKPTFALREQVINAIQEGRLYLRAGHIDPATNRMREVAIFDLGDPGKRRTIYADSGYIALSASGSDLKLTLFHGYMQDVSRQTPGELQRLFYHVNNIRVRGVGNQLKHTENDYKGDREMSICEMAREVHRMDSERADAYREYEKHVVNQVHILATGRAIVAGDTARAAAERPSAARAYCAATSWAASLFVKPPATPTPGAVAMQAVAGGVRAPSAGGAAAAPLPAPAAGSTPYIMAQEIADPAALVATERNGADMARIRIQTSLRTLDSLNVEIHKKFALSLACLVFVLFGAPIALRFPRGGVGLTIGVSLFVFALYYVGLIVGESTADRDLLPPWLAMWGTNIIFVAVGLVLLRRVGSERVSSRGGDMAERLEAAVDRLRALGRRLRAAPAGA